MRLPVMYCHIDIAESERHHGRRRKGKHLEKVGDIPKKTLRGQNLKERYISLRLKAGHESIAEHASVSARFTVDRGVTHELVRHRLCAFTQESTRYCDYDGEGEHQEMTFIIPPWCPDLQPGVYGQWESHDDMVTSLS